MPSHLSLGPASPSDAVTSSDLKVSRAHSAVSFFDNPAPLTRRPRRVSFADNHGLELEKVVEFYNDGGCHGITSPLPQYSSDSSPDFSGDDADESDCIDCLEANEPCVYHRFMGKAPPLLESVSIPRMGLSFLFTICPERQLGCDSMVALSTAKFDPKTCTLYGDIAVANVAFEKQVCAAYFSQACSGLIFDLARWLAPVSEQRIKKYDVGITT